MELYIHFGIYKAGSSYLQYVCANSRNTLLEQGVFFPDSPEDNKMKLGLISAGNGNKLATALGDRNTSRLQQIISSWVKSASNSNCQRILVSTEAIVHHFTDLEKLQLLEQAAKAVGIDKIKALGFFRDLLSHALSTYKHRAASGKFPDYTIWLQNYYETPTVLTNFLASHSQCNIEWTFRKFKKDSNHLLNAYFSDWLKISLKERPVRERVNESLTLSDIIVISKLSEQSDSYLAITLSKNLYHLSGKLKAPDGVLKEIFLSQAALLLEQYNPLLAGINSFLPQDELLELIKQPRETPHVESNITWSENQLQVLVQTTTAHIGWKGVIRQLYHYTVKLIPRSLRRKFIRERQSRQTKAN